MVQISQYYQHINYTQPVLNHSINHLLCISICRIHKPTLSQSNHHYCQLHQTQRPIQLITMNNQSQPRELFLKSEAAIGITKDNYARRFLYSHNQTNDNYLLDKLTVSPSQLQGLNIQQEKTIGYLMSEIIFRAGESLKLPVSTTVVAVCIAHQFYSRVSFLDYDFRDAIMGAIFLACKSEQTLRKSYEVALVCDHLFKIFEGQKPPIKVMVLNSNEYEFMKRKVLKMQNEILFTLGFEVYRLFDIPHRYIGGLFKSFERHPRGKEICQRAWTCLNDLYRTNCCLFYPAQAIAAAAIYISMLKLRIKMPTVPWWVLIEANLESIEELAGQLEAFYEISAVGTQNLEWVSTQIGGVGEKNGLVNVCPVNYYRKIILEQNQQLSITRPIAIEPIQPQEQTNQPLIREDSISSDNKASRKDKRKREKKDKKRKKERRDSSGDSQDRSRSRDKQKDRKYSKQNGSDRSRSQSKSIAQIRNNDDTPKLNPVQKPRSLQPIKSETIPQEKKEVVKQMQVGSAKGLLSMISSQLKKHEHTRKQQTEKQPSSDSDNELLAELIRIKKNNASKSNNEHHS